MNKFEKMFKSIAIKSALDEFLKTLKEKYPEQAASDAFETTEKVLEEANKRGYLFDLMSWVEAHPEALDLFEMIEKNSTETLQKNEEAYRAYNNFDYDA